MSEYLVQWKKAWYSQSTTRRLLYRRQCEHILCEFSTSVCLLTSIVRVWLAQRNVDSEYLVKDDCVYVSGIIRS